MAVADTSSFEAAEVAKISFSSGVLRRHLAGEDVCTSDLCFAAATQVLKATGWEPESVGGLIFVSQTPDYVLPATACSLHGRLGLSKECVAFDVNLGCSGYVYGLWLAGNLIGKSSLKRILLLAGDTISRLVSPQDRSVAMLFGDAGTATALEFHPAATPMFFELGTDGKGERHLAVNAGGFRRRRSPETDVRSEREGGNIRSDEDLFMNGGEIFAFTLKTVPKLCQAVLGHAGWEADEVDAFVMHQANRFMLQHLTKLMRLPPDKVVLALETYGNTSSASIPLALTAKLSERLAREKLKMVLAGFGVGFSWAAVALECGLVPALTIHVS